MVIFHGYVSLPEGKAYVYPDVAIQRQDNPSPSTLNTPIFWSKK